MCRLKASIDDQILVRGTRLKITSVSNPTSIKHLNIFATAPLCSNACKWYSSLTSLGQINAGSVRCPGRWIFSFFSQKRESRFLSSKMLECDKQQIVILFDENQHGAEVVIIQSAILYQFYDINCARAQTKCV